MKLYLLIVSLALVVAPSAWAQSSRTTGATHEHAAGEIDATELGTDSVDSDEIATDAVGSDEITANAVESSEIATDAVGSAEIAAGAVDTSEITENAVEAEELAAITDSIIFCGQNAENGTIYLGPATAAFGGDGSDASLGSTACDALDNATEATIDAPISAGGAVKVHGFRCVTDAVLAASESIVYVLRSAEADTTPQLACILSEAETTCTLAMATTTDIAAGATMAMQAAQTSNNTDDNSWCRVYFSFLTGDG